MRDTLEDLYYGNITPCDKRIKSGSPLQQVLDEAEQLTELLAVTTLKIICQLPSGVWRWMVKKSDIEKLDAGIAVQQANATWGLGEVKNSRILERKVRSL